MTAKFTKFRTDSNWVDGVVGPYKFQAKLFDEPSEYGINNGRVSKLCMTNRTKTANLVNYDRGWDVEPNDGTIEREAMNAVLLLCENSPKRFETA